MKPFILFVLIMTPNGVNTSTTPFADKTACEAALNTLAADFNALNGSILKGQLTFYLHCQAVQTTEESR